LLAHRVGRRFGQDLTVVRHALRDFRHGRGERRRLAHREVEQSRPGLITDFQHVAETARGGQCRAGTGPRDERIGAARGAKPQRDRRHRLREREAKQIANGDDRGFEVGAEFVGGARVRGALKAAKPQATVVAVEGDDVTGIDVVALFIDDGKTPTSPEVHGVVAARWIDNRVARRTVVYLAFDAAAREQLEPMRGAIGRAGERVGKRAADVDPEFPPRVCHGMPARDLCYESTKNGAVASQRRRDRIVTNRRPRGRCYRLVCVRGLLADCEPCDGICFVGRFWAVALRFVFRVRFL
jgi:hypothetical protein